MKDKAIEALKELQNSASKIVDGFTLKTWKSNATNVVIRIYGQGSATLDQIKDIKTGYYSNYSDSADIQKQASELISGLIQEIERFGLPEKTNPVSENSFHINLTQNQNQETKISLQFFIEIIRDELTGSQQREIQQIIDKPEIDTPTKKKQIIDKLKNFGGDIASNIVANILTNPGLYGG